MLDASSTIILFDRFLFAFTIASHIILVSLSIALIIIISIAEFISIRRNDIYYSALSKRLSKVFAIIFGIGTASGIVMAVELVTLFPTFMTLVSQTGAILVFYVEIFAFFLETIALVMYLYYADYFSRYKHWILSVSVNRCWWRNLRPIPRRPAFSHTHHHAQCLDEYAQWIRCSFFYSKWRDHWN